MKKLFNKSTPPLPTRSVDEVLHGLLAVMGDLEAAFNRNSDIIKTNQTSIEKLSMANKSLSDDNARASRVGAKLAELLK